MTQRTARIIETAYELLDEAGLEGLTIRAVLARAGLARRAFYDRFAGKDDLVLAVFTHTLQRAADHFTRQIAAEPDALERLRHIVTGIVLGQGSLGDAHWRSNRRGAALSREHLRLAQARPADLQIAIRPLTDLITAQVAAGMAAGQVRAGDAARLAGLVYNLVSTTTHVELLAEESRLPDRERREALARDIWTFCHAALAVRP